MGYSQPLDVLPGWAYFLLLVGFLYAVIELGYRIGHREVSRNPEARGKEMGTITGAALGMMTFFLVFQIGLAGDRYANRRQLVTKEANAIRTAYLRAGYLGEPYRTDIRQLLAGYAADRLAAAQDPSRLPEVVSRSQDRLTELWNQAEKIAIARPNEEVISLFIDSANDVINAHTERLMAVSSRISQTVWTAIYLMILLGFVLLGYQNGLQGQRQPVATIILMLVFAGVMLLLADLDRPWEGMFKISQQPIIDLLRSMNP
jgi:hypothetical protein